MKQISVSKGKYMTLVDDDVYEELNKHKWCLWGGYVGRDVNRKPHYMHRELLNVPKGLFTDHINGNRLDNRCSNLRICTAKQNKANQKPSIHSSKFKGVTYRAKRNKWEADIKVNGKSHFLAICSNEKDAAIYYDVAAQLFHGKFARLNFA